MSKMKYVWAAVLVALCVSLSGAALAADGWTVTAQDLPTAIEWDASVAASVDADNTGDTDWTEPEFELVSVDGPTTTAVPVNRWGLESVPVEGVTVAPDGSYLFEFDVVGPPITTMLYATPLTPTTVAAWDTLDCNWILADSDMLITTDIAPTATVVGRFFDCQPGTDGAWARFWVEECAGRVPLIVAGFGGNDYRPTLTVTRDQMAVYMARALNLPTAAYEGIFPADVLVSQWAWPWIEALQRAGIVQGFDATHYGPGLTVNRDAMAVYVARGMEGGIVVPSGPATATFDDVPVGFWAYDEIEYCVTYHVVAGYTPTSYMPAWPVTRDQMTVFVYRGFIMPTGTAVLLGGPAITAVDPGAASYDGWTSSASGPDDDPGYAYVILDAARLDTDMADLDVTFELIGPESPTPTATATLDAVDIQAAIDAVDTSGGVPYLTISWDIPAGLATGDYTLVVTIGGNVVARQPAFTIEPG